MRRLVLSSLILVPGCSDDGLAGGSGTSTATQTGTPVNTSSSEGGASVGNTSADGTSAGDTNEGGTTEGAKFDVGGQPDSGTTGPVDAIPMTCAEAEQFEMTVGCLFYAVDLDNYTPWDMSQYGVAVANVQEDQAVNVLVEVNEGGIWQNVSGPVEIAAKELHVFQLPERHQEGSGVQLGGAYRITADVPVIAYQFGPLGSDMDLAWASADASMLYPAPAWDTVNHVVGMISTSHLLPQQGAYVTVVAAHDGTVVTVTPSVATMAGDGVPAGSPGIPLDIDLDEGDVVEIMTKTQGESMTGTRVTSNADHPVGVFSGHECANIPADVYACDHLEEQMAGVSRWGTQFVAARMPVRVSPAEQPEPSLWQIYASEDQTTVTLAASAAITGLPSSPLSLDAGEIVEFLATGSPTEPGDFSISADKPIAVANYMTSQDSILSPDKTGDPAMVMLSPVEQFLPRYVVLVPTAWPTDQATFTRPTGSTVMIDGVPIANDQWIAVGPDFEVARVGLADGVYLLEGDEPFAVAISGRIIRAATPTSAGPARRSSTPIRKVEGFTRPTLRGRLPYLLSDQWDSLIGRAPMKGAGPESAVSRFTFAIGNSDDGI